MYGISMEFPAIPTKQDIKNLKKQVAYDKFGVVDGGKAPNTADDKTPPKEK